MDGPDAALMCHAAMARIDAVTVLLNESCWLGIDGAARADSGTRYRQAIEHYVKLLNRFGMIPILSLNWSAPARLPALGQQPMPDEDHSVAFWRSVAIRFRRNSSVIFDLYNEPFPGYDRVTTKAWRCWRNGGRCAGVSYYTGGGRDTGIRFRAAGMQQLVDVAWDRRR
jgi:endoglucanase